MSVGLLELFQIPNFDNKRILPVFKNGVNQNNYFLSHSTRYSIEVNFNKIGEPLVIKMGYDLATNYNYGRIKIGGYLWYYFSIIDLTVNEHERTIIHYEVDYWNTFSEMNRINLGDGVVHRRFELYDNEYQNLPRQPFSPIKMNEPILQPITSGWSILLSLSQIKIGGTYQKGLTYFCIPYVGCEEVEGRAISFFNSYFINSDIVGAWLCPFRITAPMMGGWSTANASSGYSGYYTLGSMNINASVLMPSINYSINIGGFQTNEMETSGFCDAYGNILWTTPFKYYGLTSCKMQIHMSAQTCQVEVIVRGNDSRSKVNNGSFTYCCPTIDVVLNNWSDYCARTREYEMQSRKLQNEQALVGAVTQAGAGAMTGALIGSAVPVIGTAVGAVAGAVTSVAVSGVQYAVNNSYSPKFQNLEDERYKLTQDTLSLSGTSLLEYLKTMVCVYAFKLQGDNYSVNRMLDDVGTFGYYVSETRNGNAIISIFKSSSLTEGGLQMDMSISGTIPEAWKGKIAERFSNGVILKKIGTW